MYHSVYLSQLFVRELLGNTHFQQFSKVYCRAPCVTLWFFEFLFFLFAEKMRQGHV